MPAIDKSAAQEALQVEGTGPREPRDDMDLFERNCLGWLRGWVQKHGKVSTENRLSLFIFRQDEKVTPFSVDGKSQKGFRVSHPKNIGGHVYYCTVDMSSAIKGEALAGCDDMPPVCEWLEKNGKGRYLAIAFDSEYLEAYVVDQQDFNAALRIPLSPAPSPSFDWGDLDQILDAFYKKTVYTQRGGCFIWSDAKKRKLCREPEKTVQKVLALGLFLLIEHHKVGTVSVEVDNPKGREDVEIKLLRNGNYEIGIIELKVLRPDKGEDWNLKWALKGIQQVLDYGAGSVHLVVRKLACCYDGRKVDLAMPEFFKEAGLQGVEGRRYFMESEGVTRKFSDYVT